MPQRLQLSRRKGFRLPPGAMNVARPTRWGNPHRVGFCFWCSRHHNAEDAVRAFRRDLLDALDRRASGAPRPCVFDRMAADLHTLRDHDLACWCKPGQPCHADVLLELANAPLPVRARPAAPPRRRPPSIIS
jgi:hypothetical protein